eukprot:CAMPEP_0169282366 /NCGR_PEP_ID=MMETSP1016-20121227/56850_1 /TAXON_ID=342587 /ORGANISM="Karlodinium micrum, Strain CCMP2283" /LENGTH=154 /DNA_ID=CAMNT_0009371249 /DNA_START=418 /DNA_END=879 /DNA_ORIENTATION=-
MVRMYPQRYLHQQELPDVALLFSDDKNSEVAPLNKGDWIEFEATMTAHGHRGDPEVMMLWDVKQSTRPDPVSSSVGQHGNGHAFSRAEGRVGSESQSRGKEVPPPATAAPVASPTATEAPPAATEAPPAATEAPPAATVAPELPAATQQPLAAT